MTIPTTHDIELDKAICEGARTEFYPDFISGFADEKSFANGIERGTQPQAAAWRFCCKEDGSKVPNVSHTRFARKSDVEMAIAAMERHGIIDMETYRATDREARLRIVAEAMAW